MINSRSCMFTTVDILLVIAGLIILARNQYPLWGKSIVTGQQARNIGLILLFFGSASLVGYAIAGSLSNRSNNLVRLVIQLIQFGVLFYIYRIHRRHAHSVERQEGSLSTSSDVLTVPEAAHYLKVDEIDILRLIEDGDLKATSINGEYRIAKKSLDEMFRS